MTGCRSTDTSMSLRITAVGERITLETRHAPTGAAWTIVKPCEGEIVIDGQHLDIGQVEFAPARPITLLRLMIADRRTWPGFCFMLHGIAFSQLLVGAPGVYKAAAAVAFIAHMATLWPLMDALHERLQAKLDLNALKVKFKLRTGEDA